MAQDKGFLTIATVTAQLPDFYPEEMVLGIESILKEHDDIDLVMTPEFSFNANWPDPDEHIVLNGDENEIILTNNSEINDIIKTCQEIAKSYEVYLALSSFQESVDLREKVPKSSEISFILGRSGKLMYIKRKSYSPDTFYLKTKSGENFKTLFLICDDCSLTPKDDLNKIDIILHPSNVDEIALLNQFAKYNTELKSDISPFGIVEAESLFDRVYGNWTQILSDNAMILGSDSFSGMNYAFKTKKNHIKYFRPDLEVFDRYEMGKINEKFNYLIIDIKK